MGPDITSKLEVFGKHLQLGGDFKAPPKRASLLVRAIFRGAKKRCTPLAVIKLYYWSRGGTPNLQVPTYPTNIVPGPRPRTGRPLEPSSTLPSRLLSTLVATSLHHPFASSKRQLYFARGCSQDTQIDLFHPPLFCSSHLIRRDRPLVREEELDAARH